MRAILLVDHGSRRPEPNQMLACVAAMVRERVPADVIVTHAHMDLAPPDIATAFTLCVEAGATEVIVHPYFLAPGRHAAEDIPHLVEAAALAHPHITFRITAPLGVHPGIADAILARCEDPPALDETCHGDPTTCPLRFCKPP